MSTNPQYVMHTLIGNATRTSQRFQIDRESTLRWNDGLPRDVVIENLSCSGFRIAGFEGLPVGEEIMVGLAGVGTRKATVIWSEGELTGCQFFRPISAFELEGTMVASTLVNGPSAWSGHSAIDQDKINQRQSKKLSRRRSMAFMLAVALAGWLAILSAVTLGWYLIA